MKKKFSYKDILYKSKRLMVLGLVVVLGTGVIVTSGLSGNDEIPVHDGEVLVDSLTAAGEDTPAAAETGDFESMRAQLELDRNKLLASLDSTINNSTNDAEKDNASAEKDRIMEEYGIFRCSSEQFAELDPAAVKGKKESAYGVEAIVRRDKVPAALQLSPVDIEQLFIFMVKEAN